MTPRPPPSPSGTATDQCKTCGGAGYVMVYDSIEPGISVPAGEPCPDCDGPTTPPPCSATPNPGSALRCGRPEGHDGNHSAWSRGEHGVYGHTNWPPASSSPTTTADEPTCSACGYRAALETP